MRTALVTGGAGYIGSHVAWTLLDAGWRVVVLDDLSTGVRAAVPPPVEFVQGDVGDIALVRGVLRRFEVGAVLHMAGSISAPESVRDPLRYFDNNTAKSRALLEAMTLGGVDRLVFSSSAAVYGAPATTKVAENTPPRPINPYGASKLMTEVMLQYASAAHGLRYVALRYFNVGGADPCGRAGPRLGSGGGLLDVALDAAAGLRGAVPVFGTDHPTPDGTGVRDYIHVSDLAQAHLAVLDHPGEGGVFNVGYGRGASVAQVLNVVQEVTGVPLQWEFSPRRAGDPSEIVADNARILAETSWEPTCDTLEALVADAWRWRRTAASAWRPSAPRRTGSDVLVI